MAKNLRNYQSRLKAGIYSGWQQTHQAHQKATTVVACTATGSGKTVVMGNIAAELQASGMRVHGLQTPSNAQGVIIAHRKELVGQISRAMAAEGLRHNLLASQATVKEVVHSHMHTLKASYYDPRSTWTVASVDTLIARGFPAAERVAFAFTDECFVAGTLVDGRPIEQIKEGDIVTAFNESTHGLEHRRVVRTFKNAAPDEMALVKVAHHVLHCTNGHPFYTRRGWVVAAELKHDDELLLQTVRQEDCDPDGIAQEQFAPEGLGVLRQDVRICMEVGARQEGSAANDGEQLQRVQCCSDANGLVADAMEDHGSRVLQQGMFGGIQIDCEQRNDGADKPCACVCKDGNQEPNAQPEKRCKNESVACCGESQTACSWRERSPSDGSRIEAITDAGAAWVCASRSSENRNETGQRVPAVLQTGLHECYPDGCGGSGRTIARQLGAQSAGREEGRVLAWARLDSVSFYKRSDIGNPGEGVGDGFVYNFEVEGLHTYVANDVVVHNCHHVLAENKWGRAQQMFPNAFGLGMTATPCRADGQGLGEHAEGLAHALVEGPGLAELIRDAYLVNYRVLKTKPADFDMSGVHVTPGGEWNQKEAAAAVKRSRQIIGDAVRIYKEHTNGKRAILFAADIEHAEQMAAAFNEAGVAAMNVSGAKDTDRESAIEDFKSGKLLVLINVDLFGEGFDVPACEVVLMCRPTKSFALYSQMIGRMLRLDISQILMAAWDTYTVAQRLQFIAESPKPQATLIDLVGNVGTQYRIGDYDYVGLPEGFNNWTLDRRSRARAPSDGIPLRRCTNLVCGKDYERTEGGCPYCGTVAPPPAQRGTVQAVDGDVFELEGELLAQMRGNVLEALEGGEKISDSWLATDPRTAGMAKSAAETKKHAVQTLMQHIDAWARHVGHDHGKCAKVFYYKFGMDVLTALSQPAGKCAELSARISKEY